MIISVNTIPCREKCIFSIRLLQTLTYFFLFWNWHLIENSFSLKEISQTFTNSFFQSWWTFENNKHNEFRNVIIRLYSVSCCTKKGCQLYLWNVSSNSLHFICTFLNFQWLKFWFGYGKFKVDNTEFEKKKKKKKSFLKQRARFVHEKRWVGARCVQNFTNVTFKSNICWLITSVIKSAPLEQKKSKVEVKIFMIKTRIKSRQA